MAYKWCFIAFLSQCLAVIVNQTSYPVYTFSLPILSKIYVTQPTTIQMEMQQKSISLGLIDTSGNAVLTPMWTFGGSSPGPTIIVNSGVPLKVQWQNCLPSTHLIPSAVNTNFSCGTSTSVSTGSVKVNNCLNPTVRTSVHVHGIISADTSDGHPAAWWDNHNGQSGGYVGARYAGNIFTYPNSQEAAHLFYHEHAVGITAANNYAGLHGSYWIRDRNEASLNLPTGDYEIPIAINNLEFNSDGTLLYTNEGSWLTANGVVFPKLVVEPRRYRFRIVNVCLSRHLNLTLRIITNATTVSSNQVPVTVIGGDQGFLNSPVSLNLINDQALLTAPAERWDAIFDFTKSKGGSYELTNYNVEHGTNQIVNFEVSKSLSRVANPPVPTTLRTSAFAASGTPVKTRKFAYYCFGAAGDQCLTGVVGSNNKVNWLFYENATTEIVQVNTTEEWWVYNLDHPQHPFHVHQTKLQVISRQNFNTTTFAVIGANITPNPLENGPKDVLQLDGGTLVKFRATFTSPGLFVWHCHLLQHEDNSMMRPLLVH